MTTEESLLVDRTNLVFEQWPHLSSAYGCLNCDLIFRAPTAAGKCPQCASESVFDVAAALAVERSSLSSVVGVVEGMIEQLDAELQSIDEGGE